MSGVSQSPDLFIGWDVGGWNCDNNADSRDAIVILDAYKLRGNVQKQAQVLNRLQTKALPEADRVTINEMVGHSKAEIAAGIALALTLAVPMALWLR